MITQFDVSEDKRKVSWLNDGSIEAFGSPAAESATVQMDSYLLDLMNDPSVSRFIDERGSRYGIRVLGQGDNLFFQESDDALICQIDAAHGVIYTRTIQRWSGKGKLSCTEKERVVALIHY